MTHCMNDQITQIHEESNWTKSTDYCAVAFSLRYVKSIQETVKEAKRTSLDIHEDEKYLVGVSSWSPNMFSSWRPLIVPFLSNSVNYSDFGICMIDTDQFRVYVGELVTKTTKFCLAKPINRNSKKRKEVLLGQLSKTFRPTFWRWEQC